ncbi:hypothetical protein [Leptothoe kymatousa]|uniref:Uncharacterized protein n=1 Tax=Leptothoe kymatousa TAU-MAC 1615 TaxID=2364775 RepID=A0ABS5XZS3_9CYAN|nr:hypothetical protein [Leptothoe kymatousa]MBT9311070.1 hypothetical protein [Leptothoe kymatousa TAU-MAC 1615]
MITIEVTDAELQRLMDALTIACDAYGARGMEIQSIPFELLRDKLEALQSGADDYDYDY